MPRKSLIYALALSSAAAAGYYLDVATRPPAGPCHRTPSATQTGAEWPHLPPPTLNPPSEGPKYSTDTLHACPGHGAMTPACDPFPI